MKYWVAGFLAASLTINILLIHKLWFSSDQSSNVEAPQFRTDKDSQQFKATKSSQHAVSSIPNTKRTLNNTGELATQSEQTSEGRWAYLQKLREANRYEELLYEVQLYLREYPKSIEGLLLEAEAIYHSQPLNVAIVHYYQLKERDLPDDALLEVDKFIEINTSRTIQQFSGSGSWTLLAAFLEPLVQIDPTNRNYILPLAKSYGMDEQYSLMEDALAALPAGDQRAQQLRDSIYRNSDEQSQTQVATAAPVEELPRINQRRPDSVRLRQIDNKLNAYARIGTATFNLLVDTGASMTALRLSVLDDISSDAEFLGRFNVQTAGGMITASMYRLQELQLGRNRLQNVSVMLLADENLGEHDGLLGMNVLSRFNFVATTDSGDVIIQRK